MKQVLDHTRQKWGHDYDGVHNRYSHVPDIYAYLGAIKIAALQIIFPSAIEELGADELQRIGVDFYHRTGDGLRGFVEMAMTNMGVDEHEFQRELHALYNKINFERTLQEYPQLFELCPTVNGRLDNLRGFVSHGLVTQSCLVNWAVPGLKRQERFDYFLPHALIGFEEGGSVTKSHSTRPLETIMGLMGAKPEEFVFLEDSLGNLKKAKELDERILTIHICENETDDALPDYVDIRVPNLDTFLKQAEAVFAPVSPAFIPKLEIHFR